MADKKFGSMDFSAILKDLNQMANQINKEAGGIEKVAGDAGEQVGESFVNGMEKGLEDAANRITASSIKITKAFRDLAKRITNQVDIDFSDIDINSAEFQKKIDEAFKNIKIGSDIKFDSKSAEKQFKNMLSLYMKYADKLFKLQEQKPKLTSPESIKTNAKEQLAIIDGLKEMRKIISELSDNSISLPHVYFGDTKALSAEVDLIDQIAKGEEKVGKQRDTNAKKLAEENKKLKERNKILEEKVGSIEEGELPPARKPRAKKTKVETPTPTQAGSGGSYLDKLRREAEAASKAFHEAVDKLHDIYAAEKKLDEQMSSQGIVDYAAKIKSIEEARDNALAAIGGGFSKKAEHNKSYDKVYSVVQDLIDKDIIHASNPGVLSSVDKYMMAVADYSKHTNEELNQMLKSVHREITRHANEEIDTYKLWEETQSRDKPNADALIAQRRALAKEHEAITRVHNEAADASSAAAKRLQEAEANLPQEQHTTTDAIADQNAKLEERNRLIDEYIEANKHAKAIEAKGYKSPSDMPEEDFKIWNDTYTLMQQMSMRPDYDDIMDGVRERIMNEMKAFGGQFEGLQKDLGDPGKWINQYGILMERIRQGALTATEAVAKLREEIAEKARLEEETAMLFADGTPLDDKEIQMVAKYLDIMKKKMGENYKEAEHLKAALDLVFDIKNRHIENIMDRFTAGNDASNAVLNMATDMSVNNQKNRDAALRSLNTEEYDRIIAERKSAMSKDKTEFQRKWEELASVMLGGDAFKLDNNLFKGKAAKAFEELGGTAKEGIEKINKMWLAGELEGKTFKNKYIQSYVRHLDMDKEYYAEMGKAQAGDIDMDGPFNGQADLKLTEEKAQALRNEAAAYDELIAKKKEYYGIKDVSSDDKPPIVAPEKMRKNNFARTVNGKSGKFKIKKPEPPVYETNSGQLSVFPTIEEEIDKKEKLVETNEKVAKSQKKVNEAAQGQQMTIDDLIPSSGFVEMTPEETDEWLNGPQESTQEVESEAKAMDKVGEAAENAAKSKKKFAKANKEVADSTVPSIKGIEAETGAMQEMGETANSFETARPGVNNGSNTASISDLNLPEIYRGEKGQDVVQVFAKLKSQIEEMTGKPVTIDFVSEVNGEGQLEAVGATLKYINEEAGITVKQFYDVQSAEDGLIVATQSQEKVTIAATKAAKAFNTEMQRELAAEQIKTMETRMGSLKDDTGEFTEALREAREAAARIDGDESLKDFNLKLRVAGEKAKQLKSEVKGQNTLDTIASMERALLTLPSRLDEVQRRLNALGDISGADAIDDVLRSINDEYQKFLSSNNAEEKVGLFRSVASSMVWVNAELRNLSGQSAEINKQETDAKKAELSEQKSSREAYINWWKTTLNSQAEAEVAAQKRVNEVYEEYVSLLKKRGKASVELAGLDPEKNKLRIDELTTYIDDIDNKLNTTYGEILANHVAQASLTLEDFMRHYDEWQHKISKKQADAADKARNKEELPYRNYGKTTANSAQRKLDATIGAIEALGVTNPKILAQMDIYAAKVKEVQDARDRFANDPEAAKDSALVKQFQKAAYEAAQLHKGIKAIVDEEQKVKILSKEQGFDPIELSADQIANIKDAMEAHAKATAQDRVEIKGWNDDNTKMYYTVTDSKGAVHEMTMALGQGRNMLYQYRTATKETGTLMQQVFKGIKVKAKELVSFVIGGGSVYKVIELLRQGIQYVREIDLALTELKKVTDETEESYDRFLETAAKTGARLGSTISAVTEATATFAKLGYSMEQSIEMAEAAIVYKNVGDNIASTEDAADSIISTLKGFGMEASEAMAIVDRFNEVGNRFAITSQGIGEALRLSASALNEGANSLDESIALITAANEVVNDPSSVGRRACRQ